MNSKHRKTLQTIFSDPVNGNMEWRKIEALFFALGAEKDEGNLTITVTAQQLLFFLMTDEQISTVLIQIKKH